MKKLRFLGKREQFRTLVNSGMKEADKLAKRLSIREELVTQWYRQDFVKPCKTYTQKRERFRELYDMGKFTLVEIREVLCIGHGTINNWRREDYPEGAQWKRDVCWDLYKTKKYSIERLQSLLNVERGSILRYIRQYHAEYGYD